MVEKKRILILENSVHITGALKSIVNTSEDLRSYLDFVFIIPKKSRTKDYIEQSDFSKIYELPFKELSRRVIPILQYIPYLIINTIRLRKLLHTQGIALMHSNDLYNLVPVVYKFFGGSVPYVCHIRFLPSGFPGHLFRFWFWLHSRFASRIVVVSQYLKAQLPAHAKIEYIPGEIPSNEIYPVASDEDDKEIYTFLYLGNYIPGKGQDYALEAFANVAPKLTAWHLRFIGGDMGLEKNKLFKQKLIQRAVDLGVDHRIEWKEFVQDIEGEYKNADIILNFSEAESFSNVCLEALFWGRPLIATDCGGPAEIVDNNESGLLVHNRDVHAMSEAMYKLATNKKLRIEFSSKGRATTRDRFSEENTSMKLLLVYQNALIKPE